MVNYRRFLSQCRWSEWTKLATSLDRKKIQLTLDILSKEGLVMEDLEEWSNSCFLLQDIRNVVDLLECHSQGKGWQAPFYCN